jgi:hypothetical protein
MTIHSCQLTNSIWYLNLECGHDRNAPFNGHIDSAEPYDTQQIEHLVIGFMLYEPQVGWDYTKWTKQTLEYLHTSQMFPKLTHVYLLHEGTRVNINELPDHYMVFGHNPRYFLLRSEGTKERSYGLDNSTARSSWLTTLRNEDHKALWLIGDISGRPHKLPLLYKFLKENTLDRLDYSLTNSLNNYENPFKDDDTQDYQPILDSIDEDLTLDDLIKIYNQLKKTLPGDRFTEVTEKGLVNSFDLANYLFPDEWNDASLIVMPETWFDNPNPPHWQYYSEEVNEEMEVRPFWEHNSYATTEKTWKPIATKKPFMGISKNDLQERTLQGLGFRTFVKYTSEPDLIVDRGFGEVGVERKEYIDVAHTRIISFLDHMIDYKQDIMEDIEYNYKHWKYVLDQEWQLLYRSCPPLKHVPKHKVLRMFITPDDLNIHINSDDSFSGKII